MSPAPTAPSTGVPTPGLDHLVVLADSLAQGVAWCEATLGVTPGPGGEHPLMGTHNRLLPLGGAAYGGAYLEIIAINPEANSSALTRTHRWFDMDSPVLKARVAALGPQLIHWVLRVPHLAQTHTAWAALGWDRGDIITASRPTPQGLLQWQITVRPDGQRLMDGCLPTLIAWGDTHPTQSMPAPQLQLSSLRLEHPEAQQLDQALTPLAVPGVQVYTADTPRLVASLHTPRGPVTLVSPE